MVKSSEKTAKMVCDHGTGFWSSWWNPKYISEERRAILITGCDSGIGQEAACLFHRLGFIVIAGCLFPKGKGAQRLLERTSNQLIIVDLDVTNDLKINEIKKQITDICFQRNIDLWAIINNAGVCIYGEFDWLTSNQMESIVDVNLRGVLRITKAFLPLIKQSQGRIVNISSVNGRCPYPGNSVYCATKFAIEGFSHCLRYELSRSSVQVIIVEPGDFARLTNILSSQRLHADAMWDAMTDEERQQNGDYFWAYQKHLEKNVGLMSPTNFGDSNLLRDLRDAVTSQHPKARYVSAPWALRAFVTLYEWLPMSWSDYLIMALVRRVFKFEYKKE